MKSMTKWFAFLLAILMLASTFVACNSSDNGGDTTDGEGTTDETTDEQDETTTESPYVMDLGGYQYTAYVWDKGQVAEGCNNAFAPLDFYVESLGDGKDPISTAVWHRNVKIENDYNVFLNRVASTLEQTSEMTGLWSSGKKYDLAILVDTGAAQCATMNLLTNLAPHKNLKLSESYYDQNSIRDLSLGGVIYFLSGAMNVSSLENAVVTLVNEKLYNDTLISSGEKPIYDLVKGGEWTMTKMMEMAKKANKDVGEDGAYSLEAGDIWGYLPYSYSGFYHFYGCGGRITTNGEEGYPTIVIGEDASKNAINKVMETINKAALPQGIVSMNGSGRNNSFSAQAVLFTDTVMYDVRAALYARIQDWKYGILPLALRDTDQYDAEDDSLGYITAVQYGFGGLSVWTIPSFHNDINNATIIFDAFAKYSDQPGSTMEAYYTRTISLQAAKDENSRQMVQLVRAGMAYDIAKAYQWGNFDSLVQGMLTTTSNPISELTNAKIATATLNMDKDIERFKNPELPDVD